MVLLPQRVRRIEVLEVLDEVRAVELAAAKIARQQRHPGAAGEAARVAHRVVAVVAAQYDIGAPLMTSAPAMSGRAAASIITAQPPWQLPTSTGFALSGWRSATMRTNSASASVTSASVCPGSGSG